MTLQNIMKNYNVQKKEHGKLIYEHFQLTF